MVHLGKKVVFEADNVTSCSKEEGLLCTVT